MPGLPPALPSPPGIPPPPGIPQPPIPPVPSLPQLPTPPICNIQIPIPALSFAYDLPAVALCGYKLPLPIKQFKFGLKLGIPGFPPKTPDIPLPPIPKNCVLNNPLVMICGIPFGGGRKPAQDPSPEAQVFPEAA